MLKIFVRSSSYEIKKSLENNKLAELKAKVIEILKKNDSKMLKKAIEYIESQEHKYTYLYKSLDGKWIEKAGYGVGTVRIWKGRKYKKISASPTRWVRVFDKNDRGAKSSMTRLIHKVQACTTAEELYNFCISQHAIFQDENGVDLPIMDELRAAIDERKNIIGTDINKKELKENTEEYKEDKETLQNKLVKLTKEQKKNLSKIKSNHSRILEIREAKFSGFASDNMKKDMDEHIKKLSDENEALAARNYQIENEGSDLVQKIQLLDNEDTKKTSEGNLVNKKFLKVVNKLDEEMVNKGRPNYKRSNYVIDGKNYNIATDGIIMIAQKGHDSSLEDGAISSMGRVFNNVENDNIPIPEGIDSIVKNAKTKIVTDEGKINSRIQFGNYIFDTAHLQMVQDVLGGFEGAKIYGSSDDNTKAVKFEKGQFSIVLMPMRYTGNEQSIVGSDAQKEFQEYKEKATSYTDEELLNKEKELDNKLIHEVSAAENMQLYQKLYREWQVYHNERLEREYKKNVAKQKAEREAELEKKRAEKEAKKAEREAKVKEKEASGTMIRKPEDALGNNNVDVSHSGSTLKITDKNGNLLKMVRNVTNAGKLQANKKFDVYQKVKKELPELSTPSGLNKILISGNDYYVLDNKKLYTFDEYKNRDIKKSIFDFFDVEFEENEDEAIPNYDASTPDLFNSTCSKVAEAMDSVFNC